MYVNVVVVATRNQRWIDCTHRPVGCREPTADRRLCKDVQVTTLRAVVLSRLSMKQKHALRWEMSPVIACRGERVDITVPPCSSVCRPPRYRGPHVPRPVKSRSESVTETAVGWCEITKHNLIQSCRITTVCGRRKASKIVSPQIDVSSWPAAAFRSYIFYFSCF